MVVERKSSADLNALKSLNGQLEQRFEELRSSRPDSPVYALEHGLGDRDLEALFAALGAGIRREGLTNLSARYPLVIIVASTEVGYQYRGTGTEFWPKLELRLGTSLSIAERVQITTLFEAAHIRLGLKQPMPSPWTRLFRHIAWPIANAIAPMEIQRPLATALRDVVSYAASRRNEYDLADELRFVARDSGSSRFTEWVQDQDITAALILHLLELPDEKARLSAETVRRLITDLEKDSEAREAVKRATNIHRQRRPPSLKPLELPKARLVIRTESQVPDQLMLQMPSLSFAERRQIKIAIRSAGRSVMLWDIVGPIQAEQFLSGLPIPMGDHSLAEAFENNSLFAPPHLDAPDEPGLLDLAPPTQTPLLLQRAGGSTDFEQISPEQLREDLPLRVLTCSGEPAEGVAELANLCGFRQFELDIRLTTAAQWLERRGIRPRAVAIRPQLLGGVPIARDLRGPTFADNLPIVLTLGGGQDAWTVAGVGGSAQQIGPDQAVIIEPTVGEHVLHLRTRGHEAAVRFAVREPGERDFLLAIVPEPAVPTVDDILAGRLILHVRTPAPIPEVLLRLRLETSDAVIASVEMKLETPTVLSGTSPILVQLSEDLGKTPPQRDRLKWLVLSLGEHWTERWPIRWAPRAIHWDTFEGVWRAFDDNTQLDIEIIDAKRPVAPALVSKDLEQLDALALALPVVDGEEQLLEGRCVGPRTMRLGHLEVTLPGNVPRSIEGKEGTAGLERLMTRYLAWNLAITDNLIIRAGRARVTAAIEQLLVRQLCGATWVEQEYKCSIPAGSHWDVLTLVGWDRGLTAGGSLPEIAPAHASGLRGAIASEMKSRGSARWSGDEDPPADEFASTMDEAVIAAYEKFGRSLPPAEASEFEDVDTYGPPEAWLEAWSSTVGRIRGISLSRLILPSTRAAKLCKEDYTQLSSIDVVELLDATHSDLNAGNVARWLSREHLHLGFCLWVRPQQVVETSEWLQAVARLLDDRPTARAIRYAALRYRASRHLSAGQVEIG